MVGANAGASTGPFPVSFVNASGITINAAGGANPYASVINVNGVTGSISKVTARLTALSHPFPDDLEILLVGPDGQKVILMSDAGGGTPFTGSLGFDDSAATPIPDENPITSGTYHPANYDSSDTFPLPAPASPYPPTFPTSMAATLTGTGLSSSRTMEESTREALARGDWIS